MNAPNQLLVLVTLVTATAVRPLPAAAPPKAPPPQPRDALDTLPPSFGLKRLVAVTRFDNKSGYQGKLELGNGLADMLTDALSRSGRFIVVERLQIQDALREQDFARSGRAVEAGAPEIGRLLNTQAIVIGTVTHYDEHLMLGAGQVGQGGPAFQVSTATARLEINIRVVDTTTGEVLLSQSSRAFDQASTLASEFGGVTFAKTATGKVCQQAITDAVMKLCRGMDVAPWRGRVVEVRGQDILINAGLAQGIVPGDCFRVFKQQDALLDTETGLPLGSPLSGVGVIEVREAQDKFSIARSRSRGAAIERGQIARFVPACELGSSPGLASMPEAPPWPADPPALAAIRGKNAKSGGTAGLTDLSRFLKDHPDDPNALWLRARVILKSASSDKRVALQDAQKLGRLRPADPDVAVLEARAAIAVKEPKTALAALERCLRMDPANLEAVLLHRLAAGMTGDADTVFRDSRRAFNLGYRPRPKYVRPPESFGPKDPLKSLPPIYGPKPRLAIHPFAMQIHPQAAAVLGAGLTDALADRLAGTGRFILVERQQIEDVLREQNFAQSGRTAEQAAPQIGRLLNAQALMFGAVTRFDWKFWKGPADAGGGANYEVATATVHLNAAARLVDVNTGQVLYAKEVARRKSKSALGGAYAGDNIAMNSPAMARLPVAEISQMVVDELALDIARSLQPRAWLGRIADVRGEDIYINAGAEQSIMRGDCFVVLSEQELRDPDTGLSLGAANQGAGAIEVLHVEPKFAIARAVRGSGFARHQALKFAPAHLVKDAAKAAAPQPPAPDTPAVAQARALFAKSGHYAAARELDKIIEAHPGDASALWARLEINLKSAGGDKHQALRDARRLGQLRPADPQMPLLEARAAAAARDTEATLSALDRALELDPNNLDAVLWHKELSESIGDFEAAGRDARRAFNLGADPAKARRKR